MGLFGKYKKLIFIAGVSLFLLTAVGVGGVTFVAYRVLASVDFKKIELASIDPSYLWA